MDTNKKSIEQILSETTQRDTTAGHTSRPKSFSQEPESQPETQSESQSKPSHPAQTQMSLLTRYLGGEYIAPKTQTPRQTDVVQRLRQVYLGNNTSLASTPMTGGDIARTFCAMGLVDLHLEGKKYAAGTPEVELPSVQALNLGRAVYSFVTDIPSYQDFWQLLRIKRVPRRAM